MYFTLFFLVVSIGSLLVWVTARIVGKKLSYTVEEPFLYTGLVGLTLTIIFAVIWGYAYSVSLYAYGDLLAYPTVRAAYQEAVETTATDAVVNNAKGFLGSWWANRRHSQLTSARIKELRDYLRAMEEKLHRYRQYNSRWLTRQFIASMPEGLQ